MNNLLNAITAVLPDLEAHARLSSSRAPGMRLEALRDAIADAEKRTTPEQFVLKMRASVPSHRTLAAEEQDDYLMIDTMCELLRELGYDEGVAVYYNN